MKGGGRVRLDQALVERGLCPSRENAKRSVLAGQIRVNGARAAKPSDPVGPADLLEVMVPMPYVSRGGFKLARALEAFGLDVTGWTLLDIGASTGGFTDCLLQRGAARVCAVDVGRGQLAWKLRQDPRVVVREGLNARHLTARDLPAGWPPADGIVMDCSFISLRLVLPPVVPLLRAGGRIVALVKPQFEAGKTEVDRGAGVITDPAVHERVLGELQAFVEALPGLHWRGHVDSPILGPAGNKEFLALLEKAS